ncbi:MAG: translation initiation factor IF-2 [Spirochaetes bacterium]|nr:translation initiation factor IF-2 [Spirochaetota bacterium]
MTEEQDKQKPKITLIKHKKDDPPPAPPQTQETTKKKVVVVKKKVVVKKAGPSETSAPVSPELVSVSKPGEVEHPEPIKSDSPQGTAAVETVRKEPIQDEKPVPETPPQVLKQTESPIQPTPEQGLETPVAEQKQDVKLNQEVAPPEPSAPVKPTQVPPSPSPKQPQSFPTKRAPQDYGTSYRGQGRGYPGAGATSYGDRGGERPSRFGTPPGSRPSGYSRTGGRAGIVGGKPVNPPVKPVAPPPVVPAEENKGTSKKVFKAKKKEFVKHEKIQEKEIQLKKKTVTRTNPVPKSIDIMEVITVSELARKMNLKASELIAKLMSMGMMVTINQQIDAETAAILAAEYDCKVNIVSLYDETVIHTKEDREEDLQKRPPIVTIMGHVDHGKTKLLDAIRTSNVAEGEYGGITQHIGAYMVEVGNEKITFLDTPGHEAFSMMRARGAQITDIVVLVVAANDGVMPQTVEAINHAKEAKVPIIVAINKIDLPDANPERVKKQLSEYDLIPEEWGGKTLYVNVSALKKIGIQDLLETILLQAEMMDLKANYNCPAEGKVVESKIDHGRGIVATILIQRGTLRIGDTFVAGIYPGKVRAIFNDRGVKLEEATPSMPVEVLGFTGIPEAGDPFQVTENEKIARQIGDKRQELKKMEEARNLKRITLDNLYESIKEGEVQELKVIIKGDVHGSVEALKGALEKLSTPEIRLSVIHASAGAINEGDVRLASASNAIIIGFHVRPTPKAQQLAEVEKVEIRKYNIIYDAVDDIRAAMEGLLKPELKEETLGTVEVREVFKVPKVGTVAGCYVVSGKIRRNAQVHVIREGIEIYTGKIASLKRFKEDVREVEAGFECGVSLENYQDIRVGDQLEVFEVKEYAKKLGEG